MNEQVLETIGNAVKQTRESGPEQLHELAKDLAVWATVNTVNDDGSKLREKGYVLAGAIADWTHELYPNFEPPK